MISGNMILPPILGHRKPTSAEQQEISAAGFSIGSKGYIGTGTDGNAAIQRISGNMILPPIPGHRKPTLGEKQEQYATGFSIDTKGYIGTGNGAGGSSSFLKDFYEYDPCHQYLDTES